jgi:hypothetical protein
MPFTRASKTSSKLRLAVVGPSGSGKTYSSLAIATGLGQRIAVIDTERGSASKYAGLFQFDQVQLESFHPQRYIDAIAEAAKAGYDVLIIDSLSHAWSGKDGALHLVDEAARRSKTGSTFNAWRDVTPLHMAMIDSIVAAPLHIIATFRVKTEYVLEKDERTGKTVPRKIGLAPVQREGTEYEFDIVAELDQSNAMSITKSRAPGLTGTVTSHPGAEFGRVLAEWLGDGSAGTPLAAGGNGSFESLPPVDQARVLIDQATNETELRALLPRIKALSPREQAALRAAYAARKEALHVLAQRQ